MITNDRMALDRLREETMAAESSGDAAYFEGVAAEDVVVMPPGVPAVIGRAAAVAFMQEFLGNFDRRIRYLSEEIQIRGDVAFDRGTYSETTTPRGGGASISETGKYLWLHARKSGNTWEFWRVILNVG